MFLFQCIREPRAKQTQDELHNLWSKVVQCLSLHRRFFHTIGITRSLTIRIHKADTSSTQVYVQVSQADHSIDELETDGRRPDGIGQGKVTRRDVRDVAQAWKAVAEAEGDVLSK